MRRPGIRRAGIPYRRSLRLNSDDVKAPPALPRVMGVRMLAVYGLPLGLLAAGAGIERVGYPTTITVYATIGLLFTLLIGLRWRGSMWHPRPT